MKITLPAKKTGYTVDPQAETCAKQIGLGGDVVARLARMAKRSVPLTHEHGNRRFGAFVLQIEAQVVRSVSRL